MSVRSARDHHDGALDLVRLINKEEDVIQKLREIKTGVRKEHKQCSIARTAGALTSITGSVVSLAALFATAPAVSILTVAGASTVALGAGISLGTMTVQQLKAKKWAEELVNNALFAKSYAYGIVMKMGVSHYRPSAEILMSPRWKRGPIN